MSLDKKYNIPAETVHKMVRDGVISCFVIRDHEIYDAYNSRKAACPECRTWDIYCDVGAKFRLTPEVVKKVVYLFGKKS